jgi:CheY-like chemotaxis protein
VLIVDDNADAAELLGRALAEHGWNTRVAVDGPSALAAALEFAPQVALLDIGLPLMDGYEVGRRLRERGAIHLVALTGYGQRADRRRSRAAGFAEHLVKPVDLKTLRAVLTRLCP